MNMTVLGVILAVLAILSFVCIQKEQDLPKPICYYLFLGCTALFIIILARSIYNPALSRFVGAAEINPSFASLLIVSAGLGAIVVGPIALIRWLLFEHKLKQERKEFHERHKERF